MYKRQYYGTPYLSDKSDTMKPTDNIVIYGHNMRDNTMFGDLSKYKSKEFFEKHRYIYFATLVDLGKYEVVCVFKPTPSKFDYQNYTVFDSSDEFSSYISKCKERDVYKRQVFSRLQIRGNALSGGRTGGWQVQLLPPAGDPGRDVYKRQILLT